MKALLMTLLCCVWATAQDIKLEDLKTPNAPGFQLLDVSPSTIERPTSPRAVAASLFALSSGGTSIPKNIAMEFAPYWFAKPARAGVFRYLNLDDGKSNVFSGIYDKLSVSLVSVYSDSTAGSLLANTNYVAIGIRTNLVTFRTGVQQQKMKAAIKGIADRMQVFSAQYQKEKHEVLLGQLTVKENALDDALEAGDTTTAAALQKEVDQLKQEIDAVDAARPEALSQALQNDKQVQDYIGQLSAPPLFALDGAFAYSDAIPGNEYDDRRFNRRGFWLTGALSGFRADGADADSHLSVLFTVRFLSENVPTDAAATVFQQHHFTDVGGKLEYTAERLTLSIEHLRRRFSKDGMEDTERTVGSIQYKISEDVYLTGSYGRNFGATDNLFTLFGINWGFGERNVSMGKE